MTGPEHYGEAERLIERANGINPVTDPMQSHGTIALAQVHATLALAAATAYPAVRDYCGDEGTDAREWTGATS